MKKIMLIALLLMSSFTLVLTEVHAARFGGGRSIGRQSYSHSNTQNQIRPSAPSHATPPPAPASPSTPPKPSPWRGILGGALLGLGAGALLSHFGLGGAMASGLSSLLMLALFAALIYGIYRLLTAKKSTSVEPAYAYSGYTATPGGSGSSTPEIGANLPSSSTYAATSSPVLSIPADFDRAEFLRNAKVYFIRLQRAWDQADIDDIRNFTTPEMFGEIKMQLMDRGQAANRTDVISLEAELRALDSIEGQYVASVEFKGMLKENEHPAAPVTEIWNLTKRIDGSGGWVVAGIQQQA